MRIIRVLPAGTEGSPGQWSDMLRRSWRACRVASLRSVEDACRGPVSPVAPPIPRMNSFLLLFTPLAWIVHDDDEHLFQTWRRGDLMALMFHDSAS